MIPTSRKVSEEGRPERAWRLTWGEVKSEVVSRSREHAGIGSGSKGGSGLGSSGSKEGLSAMNKRTRPLYLWVELHFSSQL